MMDASLRRRAIRASVAELLGFVLMQALRLVSTLVLSRLLFPEAYGVAALVALFTQGLNMLSDVGIHQSIVQSPRGDERVFLNTGWTMQLGRGVVLWCLAAALSWPMATLYQEPELMWMLPVGALSLIFGGFTSTSLLTMRRRLSAGWLVGMELAGQVVGLVVMVTWAYQWPSAWAIVAGGLANALARCVASHLVDVGYRNRIEWDSVSAGSIMQFGKWIFGSSALSFISTQGDRLLLGHYIGLGTLGIYSIAAFISEALGAAVVRVTHGVLFPLLSQLQREDPAKLKELYYRVRLRLDFFGLVPAGMAMMLAQAVVDILYDPRYQEAGWMLQALCLRVAMGNILVPAETCLFSIGKTHFGFWQNVARSLWIVVGVPLGWHLWGAQGVVWVAAASEVPVLIVLWHGFHRHGLLSLAHEARAVLFFALGLAFGYGADRALAALAMRYGWTF